MAKMAAKSGLGKAILAAVPKVLPGPTSSLIHRLMELAIDGNSVLPSAKKTAGFALARRLTPEKAINSLAASLVSLAGAQGFLTNLGGVAATALALPSNIGAMAAIQTHLVAGLVHLRGYDITDSRVRTGIAMCLLEKDEVNRLISVGKLPGGPLTVATAPVADKDLEYQVSRLVTDALSSSIGGKQLFILAFKKVPLLGGGVGAVTDSWHTWDVFRYARKEFRSRRSTIQPASKVHSPEP